MGNLGGLCKDYSKQKGPKLDKCSGHLVNNLEFEYWEMGTGGRRQQMGNGAIKWASLHQKKHRNRTRLYAYRNCFDYETMATPETFFCLFFSWLFLIFFFFFRIHQKLLCCMDVREEERENTVNPNSFHPYNPVVCPYPPDVSNAAFNVLEHFLSLEYSKNGHKVFLKKNWTHWVSKKL